MSGKRFQMIVGVHDLAEMPEGPPDELYSWLPFSRVKPLLDDILENTRAAGTEMHVTSDDAFHSDYELLMPWLQEHGVGGTFFIPTRFLGKPGRLTARHLREMAAAGMRMGVHGARHINWTRASPQDFADDLREGREELQQILGMAVDLVAPPFGAYDGRVASHLFAQGFREIHTCRSGLALPGEALKPRNMLKPGNIDAVLAVSRRPGGLKDAARCRLRRLRASLPWLAGAA